MFSGESALARVIAVLALMAGVLAASACGGGSDEDTTPEATPAPGTPEATAQATTRAADTPEATQAATTSEKQSVSVEIKDFEFSPSTVTIKIGDNVMWTNNGPSHHTVTADDGTFDSGDLSKGGTYIKTFYMLGTFDYHCSPHPQMKGQVIVEE